MKLIMDTLLVWIGWNIAGPLLLGAIAVLVVTLFQVPRAIRQMTCAHLVFYETRACDAVCRQCGKNLGFIGAIRAQRKTP